MAACPICCETFNKSNRRRIECASCHAGACSTCVETYILSTTQDPHCMSCRHGWNREFLCESLTKVFINGRLREHRENVLFERERALLPATQPLLQQRREHVILQQSLKTLRKEKQDLKRRLKDITALISETNYRIHRGQIDQDRAVGSNKEKRFTYACPAPDCKGYIEEAGNKCGTCSSIMCSKCHEIIKKTDSAAEGEEHVCNPDTVETVKQLKKDSKPCPNCRSLIHRAQGCNQMFCTVCEHVFNWVTGEADRGPIHNPEWYALQARLNRNGQVPRDPRDMPCGGLVNWVTLNHRLRDIQLRLRPPHDNKITALTSELMTIHRVTQHLEYVELRRFRTNNNIFMRNAPIRIDYLENKIADAEFKRQLLLAERANDKQEAIHNLMHMFVIVSHDIFRRIAAMCAPSTTPLATIVKDIKECMSEFYTLEEFYHEHAENIRSRFNGCAVPCIFLETGLVR